MISDERTHRDFNEYRQRVFGLPPLSYEDWAHRREDTSDRKDKTKEFLRSSVPGSPVPDCSHT